MDGKIGFPILGTKECVPFELVKEHEAQVLKNHGGQTVERLAERGGLSYQELACVLLNHPFNEKLSEVEAKLAVNLIKDKWWANLTKGSQWTGACIPIPGSVNIINTGLRPCIVTIKTGYDKTETKKAYWHRWFDTCLVIIGQRGVESDRIPCVKGLVEYEDGTMDEHLPDNIRFTDRENG